MAKNDNYIGIAMGLDVTDLKAGLNETKKEITTANKTFAAQTSGMDDWSKNVDGLNAKLTQLDTVLKNQKKVVAGYEAELEKAKKQYGENSEQVRKLNDRLLDATAAVGKTEKAQRKYAKQLDAVESETQDTSKATGVMERAFKDADDATQKLGDGFTVLKGVMAGLITKGITSLVGGLKDAIVESREFRREMGYLEAGAESAGVSFEKAKENVKEVTAITQDQGAAIEGLNNLMTAGFDGDALDTITNELVGASIKWKDTLKFEGLADGLQETLATDKAVGPFVELLERGGIVAEDFDAGLQAASTGAEKQNFVLETLASLGLAEVKIGYEESNKALLDGAKAELEYSEAMAGIGEKSEPVMTAVKNGITDIIKEFLAMAETIDLEKIAEDISLAFKWLIDNVIPAIKDFFKFIGENGPLITAIISGVVAGFAAFAALKLIGLFLGLAAQISAAGGAMAFLNGVMAANPIGIVVLAIGALVAAFVYLWNTSEDFRNFWIGLWEAIKKAAGAVVDWLVKAFSGAWTGIKNAWSAAVKWFSNIWSGIKRIFSAVRDTLTGFFRGAWNGIKNVWSGVTKFFANIWSRIKNAFSGVARFFTNIFRDAWNGITKAFNKVNKFFGDIFDDIIGFFKDLPGEMWDIGIDIVNGLVDGMKSIIGKVGDVVGSAVDGIKGWLGIASPSKLMRDEVGKMMGEGIGVGMIDSLKTVKKDIAKFNDTVQSQLVSQLPTINAGLNLEASDVGSAAGTTTTTVINNNNYNQVINAPKQPSRIELYRQSKNLLALKGGV